MFAALGNNEPGGGIEFSLDVLGVVRPVRGDVKCAALFESIGAYLKECCLHDTSLVMALLWPGIGEIQIYPVQ